MDFDFSRKSKEFMNMLSVYNKTSEKQTWELAGIIQGQNELLKWGSSIVTQRKVISNYFQDWDAPSLPSPISNTQFIGQL